MDARDFFGYKSPDEDPRGEAQVPEGVEDADERRPPLPDEAITLDDADTTRRIDVSSMLERVAELPQQLRLARRIAAATELPARYRQARVVVVLGMGGSAIGADLVAAAAGSRLRVPLVVQRDYELPGWADEHTLIIAASHSGETAETLAAAGEALGRDLPLAVVSTGGALAELAVERRLPLLRYRGPAQPRAAIGFGVGLLHELLDTAGLLERPDSIGEAADEVEALLERNAPSVPTARNEAKQLAWGIFGRIPIMYGAGPMAAVARRWKTQFNENTKAWAMWEPMPEANHNAIEGSLNPRELSDALYLVELRSHDELSEIGARYAAVAELLGERATNRSTVWATGATPLAQVLSTVALGDLVTVYLAILYQTDPTPVTLLSMLKERLARATD
jgi:glucose/mannose-6-phosphate isomerase